MSIIMLTIVKNFALFIIIFVYGGSLLCFHQAPQVEKESGAEGEEKIDFLRITYINLSTF